MQHASLITLILFFGRTFRYIHMCYGVLAYLYLNVVMFFPIIWRDIAALMINTDRSFRYDC